MCVHAAVSILAVSPEELGRELVLSLGWDVAPAGGVCLDPAALARRSVTAKGASPGAPSSSPSAAACWRRGAGQGYRGGGEGLPHAPVTEKESGKSWQGRRLSPCSAAGGSRPLRVLCRLPSVPPGRAQGSVSRAAPVSASAAAAGRERGRGRGTTAPRAAEQP